MFSYEDLNPLHGKLHVVQSRVQEHIALTWLVWWCVAQDPKARKLKYLFAQTELFSHFMKGGPSDAKTKAGVR
jgi:hypothetical protein